MSINDEARQVAIADQLAETARTLAHSTRSVPRPSGSYSLIASLVQAQESLAQVYVQLAAWHGRVIDGTHYNDAHGPSNDTEVARNIVTACLGFASDEACRAALELRTAHSANGIIRWFDEIPTTDRAIAPEVEIENHNGEEVN